MSVLITVCLCTALTCLIFALFVRHKSRWPDGSPPGPPAHPLLEGLPTVLRLRAARPFIPYKAFHSLIQQYGPVVKFMFLFRKAAIIGDFHGIKEVTASENIDDRPNLVWIVNKIYTGTSITMGMLLNSGKSWKEVRKFTVRSLRDLGYGKTASEETIEEECCHLVKAIADKVGKDRRRVDLEILFNSATLNVIWNLVAKERFNYDDEPMQNLMMYLESFMHLGEKVIGQPLGIIPALRYVPPFRGLYRSLYCGLERCRAFIKATVDVHRQHLDTNDPQDYIDMFLVKMKEEAERGPAGLGHIFSEEQLIISCLDLFTAGSETSSKTLTYAVAFMLHHPEVQERVHEEISSLVGGRQVVLHRDRPDLPYTEATINEVWRLGNVVPLFPPSLSTGEVKVKKHTLPAGTFIMYNPYSVHMDPDLWPDPEQFRPERHLDQSGRFRMPERTLPFGIGRRKCIGEALARMENFLFFANLVYNFKFECQKLPKLEPKVGFSNAPDIGVTEITLRH